MCVRCGTGRIAWCTDPYRHGESAEPVSPGDPPVTGNEHPLARDTAQWLGDAAGIRRDYEAGRRDGANSLIADITVQFDDAADTMGDLLGFFRRLTGDPALSWPEDVLDWRDMFARYARSARGQGFCLLNEFEWTPGEWAAITALEDSPGDG